MLTLLGVLLVDFDILKISPCASAAVSDPSAADWKLELRQMLRLAASNISGLVEFAEPHFKRFEVLVI